MTITEQPLLVLAGAGSGKTRVITEKIAHLIAKGIPAKQIAAITFTNKAAREMKNRVTKLLNKQQSKGLRVSTFHSLGLDILRKEHKTLGYKANLTLFDEHDKRVLLRNLISHDLKNGDPEEVDHYAWQISQWKNNFITPEQALSLTDTPQIVSDLYKTFNQHLAAYNAIDFDDLILLPVLLFQQHPVILEKWQNKTRYILVDEYQDTNSTQYELIKLLAGKLGRITIVGDDDQSIYSWRGAQPENLVALQGDFDRLKVIKLEQNYRSSGRILKSANQLIANNPHVFEKKLWSQLSFGDPIRVLSQQNELEEALQVVSEIIHHKFKTGSQYQDYAILYRSNHQSRVFEKALRENNIPYFISGSTSFFSYSEVKDILAYLRLFINNDDDAAFLRIINTPRREIGPTTLEKLATYANQRQISLFSACFEMGLSQHLKERPIRRLTTFCEWVVDTADRMERGDTFGVINDFLETIDYKTWLHDNSKNEQSAERKIKNVYDLISWLQKIAEGDEDGEKSINEAITKIMLLDILDRNQDEKTGENVSLMTLHAAKGLEFPHVFLIGFEEEIIPHKNSVENEAIEEERRLAYVG
ncbi:MAG TPA: ATP-dependent DNA helicase Rep, partial [Methylococcaceae bacterium]|nr:ATP-dependent DNA helicase Rep [Methylococcaceae bacterium]